MSCSTHPENQLGDLSMLQTMVESETNILPPEADELRVERGGVYLHDQPAGSEPRDTTALRLLRADCSS